MTTKADHVGAFAFERSLVQREQPRQAARRRAAEQSGASQLCTLLFPISQHKV